ncbi:hypothetical protein EB796_001956 [Bugula neritina]|uniref:Uncharacterized protein n=1 Tax=Bugula neritina TaxID=10212 RepID=A0A7J7KNI6_BUGNE|nr:hypothetical protein EB796_001956 [Bugula neritina]
MMWLANSIQPPICWQHEANIIMSSLFIFDCSETRHRKIEGFHTDSRCRYKAPERHGREYILKRDCHCQNFPNDEEVHYSPNCHYTVRQDSGMDNEKVILLLKCACNTENLLARYPNTESSVCILL